MWDWFVSFLTKVLAAIAGAVGDWGLAVIILWSAFFSGER